MGSLTHYLQDGFSRNCPIGWNTRAEVALLATGFQSVLGFSPRADVLLERNDGNRRIWIEFEISRADPVANHARFATAHMFQPCLSNDVFLSMVSSHVARRRRNLAAAMTGVMRRFGIRAFQTVLLPHHSPDQIKALNQLGPEALFQQGPPVEPELERAFSVCDERPVMPGLSIHFVGDALEVFLNLGRWNDDMKRPEALADWGARRVLYFVYDPWSKLFAPSKFCAYHPFDAGAEGRSTAQVTTHGLMTVASYCRIDGLTPLFDGTRAWKHLTRNLGFTAEPANAQPELRERFLEWHSRFADAVPLREAGPILLSPPAWFR